MRALPFDNDGYGSPKEIQVIDADTMLELRKQVRERRWYREILSAYDCTGICFAQSAEILKVAKTSAGYSAVLLVTSSYDV